ncbi:MAG TPA: CPBP family intramembrane glutamic endopeptidase [Acidimicrobiales bacterium]
MTEALVLVLAVLTVHNLGVERLPPAYYVPACLVTSAAVVGAASWGGAGFDQIGLSTAGLGLGLVIGGGVAVLVVLAGSVPATRPLFADRRMAGVSSAGTAYRAVVRIPMGTVVLEEVAFRGVLLAELGVVASSVLFGLWHVVPVRATLRTNGRATRPAVVATAVAAMAVVGGGLCWLRLTAGGLAAPALVHGAATATATVVAHRVAGDGL